MKVRHFVIFRQAWRTWVSFLELRSLALGPLRQSTEGFFAILLRWLLYHKAIFGKRKTGQSNKKIWQKMPWSFTAWIVSNATYCKNEWSKRVKSCRKNVWKMVRNAWKLSWNVLKLTHSPSKIDWEFVKNSSNMVNQGRRMQSMEFFFAKL